MNANKKFRATQQTRTLAAPLQLRLYQDQRAQLEDAAAANGETVSVYLRHLVDGGLQQNELLERFLESISEIEERLNQLEGRLNADPGHRGDGALYEVLLLLRGLMRSTGGNDKISMIQADLKAMGYDIFNFPTSRR